MYYVKTEYQKHLGFQRLPNISEYRTKKEAQSFIDMCLKWGIGISSCKIVDKVIADQLISDGAAEDEE